MDKLYWNTRYAEHDAVYGIEPNRFFKAFIDSHKRGTLLLPADGEGRNAVYAAKRGWQVDAFDFSEIARKKALQSAMANGVKINYQLMDLIDFKADKQYDAVGLIYVHLPPALRAHFHDEVYKSVKPGGFLVFEAFAKEQIHFNSGGPKDVSLLYDAPTVCGDFPFLHIISCGQKELVLDEGKFHSGTASVLQMIGQKL